MKKYCNKNNILLTLINIGCILSLILVIFPLLLIAKYDYPSADDWSYGINAYKTLKAGGSFIHALCAAFQRAVEAYQGWDGRFANGFLDSLQPGIWGEEYYALTPWILIGMLIISQLFFFRFIICHGVKGSSNALLWLPVVIPMLIIQILFTPSPVESFYWYTGGMNYTFMYGLSLILTVLFLKLGMQRNHIKWRRVLLTVTAWILSIFVGGGNFSTSLSTILLLCIVTIYSVRKKGISFLQRTWFILLTVSICLAVCLASPGSIQGNSTRMTEMGSPLSAIWKSLTISAGNIYSRVLTEEVLLMLLFMIPFIWRALDNLEFSFRYPLLFSMLTFGLYASQATPNVYVYGGIGGGRVAALLYFSCILWLTGNTFYWIGWFKAKKKAVHDTSIKPCQTDIPLLLYCSLVCIALFSFIYVFDRKNISSYKAYRDWRQGLAQQYADEWKFRLEILHDDSIKTAEFMPLQYYPETLLYIELQTDGNNVNYWVNNACAMYYDKELIQMNDSTDSN